MRQLWAPWRMSYVSAAPPAPAAGCIFCLRELGAEDQQRQVLRRASLSFVMLNRYPYTNGHLLIAPYRHVSRPDALTPDEVGEIHRLLCRGCAVLTRAFQPAGFNVGMNLGRAAGAGVEDHLHLHVVPRWPGDTNFMPVLDDVRVIPQHLEETYRLLRDLFAEEAP